MVYVKGQTAGCKELQDGVLSCELIEVAGDGGCGRSGVDIDNGNDNNNDSIHLLILFY